MFRGWLWATILPWRSVMRMYWMSGRSAVSMMSRCTRAPLQSLPIMPVLVPASKERMRAPPFSLSMSSMFLLWVCMLSMVTKMKIGTMTTREPMITQGDMRIQAFLDVLS
jgi:hypothetical protein